MSVRNKKTVKVARRVKRGAHKAASFREWPPFFVAIPKVIVMNHLYREAHGLPFAGPFDAVVT